MAVITVMKSPDITVPEAKYLWTAPEILGVIFETFLEPQFNLLREQFAGERPPLPAMSLTQDELDESMKVYSPQYMLRNTWQPYTDIWALFSTFTNPPWRELFWEDHNPIAPILVSRPTPWMDEGGKIISSVAQATTTRVPVYGSDVLSWSLARTDQEVRNYFFTYPGDFGAFAAAIKLTGIDHEGMMADGPLFRKNPVLATDADVPRTFLTSSNYKTFGLRLAEFNTLYFDYDATKKKEEIQQSWKDKRVLGEAATKRLVQALGHGGVLENGSITLKGNEDIRLGCYVEVQAKPPFIAYVERVQHDFTQGSGTEGRFITTVGVTRGTRQIVPPGGTALDLMGVIGGQAVIIKGTP